jgi:hypothetical protein
MFSYYPSHAYGSPFTRRSHASPFARREYEEELELLRRQAARRAYEEELAQQEAERRRQQAAYEARLRRQLAEQQAYEEALQREAYRRQLAERRAQAEILRRRHARQQSPPVFLFTSSPPAPPQPAKPSLSAQTRAAAVIQRRYRAHRATIRHLEELASLRAELHQLTDSFAMPAACVVLASPLSRHAHLGHSLDFDALGKLTYSAANTPVHAHQDALERLLVRLDAVQSDGSETVRAGRKAIVLDVEAELGRLDAAKIEARERQAAAAATPTEAPTTERPADVEAKAVDQFFEPIDERVDDATHDAPSSTPPDGTSVPVANSPAIDNASAPPSRLSSAPAEVVRPVHSTSSIQIPIAADDADDGDMIVDGETAATAADVAMEVADEVHEAVRTSLRPCPRRS